MPPSTLVLGSWGCPGDRGLSSGGRGLGPGPGPPPTWLRLSTTAAGSLQTPPEIRNTLLVRQSDTARQVSSMMHKCTAGHPGPRFKLYDENTLLFSDVENNPPGSGAACLPLASVGPPADGSVVPASAEVSSVTSGSAIAACGLQHETTQTQMIHNVCQLQQAVPTCQTSAFD
ncbi:uncharacterized protein EHS24_007795 [Apiotrichum porosum]|uniref:Uncharacterized protein n=1 Tax=Apiotrichum porosum TaxID=105984 RepID=A0A427XS14_9TREE|nr:uncharacterized protein EHS24_007795 [Apiotrichum porosum]RSH81617.1 hypothetical protein EHS24_007795 [Apiotrichum porosum]